MIEPWTSGTRVCRVSAAAVDLAHEIVAEIDAAAGAPCADPAFETTLDLLGEILEEEGVHRPLEADMQFADLALGMGHEADAEKRQALLVMRHVGLVACQPIERLGDEDVERTGCRVFEELLIAGTEG